MQKQMSLVTIIKNTSKGTLIKINNTLYMAIIDNNSNPLKVGSSFLGIVSYEDQIIQIKKISTTEIDKDTQLNIIV